MVTLESWASGEGIEFESEGAEEAYKARAGRMKTAIEGGEPDRVPVQVRAGYLAGHFAGVTFEELMYDGEKAKRAYREFIDEFDPDNNPVMPIPSGKIFDILDYRLYNWPGDGLEEDVAYQAVEGEYLKADEYDDIIENPDAYFLRKYLPRVFGEAEGLAKLPQLATASELPFANAMMLSFGDPEVQSALDTLKEAGDEAVRWQMDVGSVSAEGNAKGYPSVSGGYAKAPFDMIGDTLRGTRDTMIDMRKRPEKLKQASEALVPMMIDLAVGGPKATGVPVVMFVLHKGADSFMSKDDFREFYWPSLKEVMEGVIDEGYVPWMFAEGSYDDRLEILAEDHPEGGNVVWHFDQTDIRRAKEVIGDQAAIAGNVPTGVLKTGTPEKVTEHCEGLVEDVGPDNFILTPGATVYRAPAENIHALIDSVKQ